MESGPEEEEVPTRGYLKRQSNLILDAKSRSKRGGRKRWGGPRVVWRGGAACAHVARVWCAPVPVSVSCVRVCHVSSVTTFNRGRGENSKLSFNFINFNFQPFLNN